MKPFLDFIIIIILLVLLLFLLRRIPDQLTHPSVVAYLSAVEGLAGRARRLAADSSRLLPRARTPDLPLRPSPKKDLSRRAGDRGQSLAALLRSRLPTPLTQPASDLPSRQRPRLMAFLNGFVEDDEPVLAPRTAAPAAPPAASTSGGPRHRPEAAPNPTGPRPPPTARPQQLSAVDLTGDDDDDATVGFGIAAFHNRNAGALIGAGEAVKVSLGRDARSVRLVRTTNNQLLGPAKPIGVDPNG